MADMKVVRLSETEVVKFGPDATYQLILGDDDGNTPIRTGIQTSEPGYVAPVHSHPYTEVLHNLDGVAEAWMDGQEDRKVRLEKGDTIALPPNVPHSFRAVGDQVRTPSASTTSRAAGPAPIPRTCASSSASRTPSSRPPRSPLSAPHVVRA